MAPAKQNQTQTSQSADANWLVAPWISDRDLGYWGPLRGTSSLGVTGLRSRSTLVSDLLSSFAFPFEFLLFCLEGWHEGALEAFARSFCFLLMDSKTTPRVVRA
ncbi:hypothetical protein AVEN_217310-1 [Araneus ventricosus]|uniref:Uncharacterized protein n=1 Tax=Araneus ventricosus TaxID=182803 RepID=A0A4Y2VTL6_ARAVE|nr:hypothetical protein AVEN_217310-1 [Araneus ventricosus]